MDFFGASGNNFNFENVEIYLIGLGIDDECWNVEKVGTLTNVHSSATLSVLHILDDESLQLIALVDYMMPIL